MMSETKYRNRALAGWAVEREAAKRELLRDFASLKQKIKKIGWSFHALKRSAH